MNRSIRAVFFVAPEEIKSLYGILRRVSYIDHRIEILRAFIDLAWADGIVTQFEVDYISGVADELRLPLDSKVVLLTNAITDKPKPSGVDLSALDLDDIERYQVVEHLVALCLLGDSLNANQAEVLASLAVQLGVNSQELEEMRRRLC